MVLSRRAFSSGALALSLAACSRRAAPTSRFVEQEYRAVPNPGYDAWVAGFKDRAVSRGIASSTLDRAFAERTISPDVLAALTAQIGEAQGQLRAIHLKYHLTTADLLSPHQRHRYAELRGYR